VTDAVQADGTIGINGLVILNAAIPGKGSHFEGPITLTIAS
jgi:hypothetical protein